MGEVYRARDTKLDRDVAIKVLPPHLASDPEALARFEREAKAVAALSHPNILSIHDYEGHESIDPAHWRWKIGALRALMARQLSDIRERGEPIAALWASEGSIYQRFGYGLAMVNGSFDLERSRATFRLPVEPAGQVELRPHRKEVEAGLGKLGTLLPHKALVELFFQPVEVTDVARGIFALRVVDFGGAPVARLLLLRQVEVQHLLDQFLEAMTVGVGPDEPGRRAGAVKRRGHDPEVILHDPDVEAGEVIKL